MTKEEAKELIKFDQSDVSTLSLAQLQHYNRLLKLLIEELTKGKA